MSKRRKDVYHLLVIDPQRDFCHSSGSLFVPGADDDMSRVSDLVGRLNPDDIHITLDSHHQIDISHPIFYIDSNGNHPPPFTILNSQLLKDGVWRTTNPAFQDRALEYELALEANNRYPHCIWPVHCDIASVGYTIVSPLYEALVKWEVDNFAMVDKVTKGSNFWTEHYSAVQADVPDHEDLGTMLNTKLIETLENDKVDFILIAGEALSHCVANTITDIADNFGEDNIKKFILLEDATSNVPNFESLGEDFVDNMKARGMQTAKTTDF